VHSGSPSSHASLGLSSFPAYQWRMILAAVGLLDGSTRKHNFGSHDSLLVARCNKLRKETALGAADCTSGTTIPLDHMEALLVKNPDSEKFHIATRSFILLQPTNIQVLSMNKAERDAQNRIRTGRLSKA
jgi:hypothetical protein